MESAILHLRFLGLLAHFARIGSAKSRHLAIPPRAKILAKALEPEVLAQRLKMLGRRGRALFTLFVPGIGSKDLCLNNVKEPSLPPSSRCARIFAGNAFLLF